VLLGKLRRIDIHTSIDELLLLFDRVGQESDLEGSVKIDVLVEAMTNISAVARSSSLLDVKYSLQAMRREVAEVAETQSDAEKRCAEVTKSSSEQVAQTLREAEAARKAFLASPIRSAGLQQRKVA